ncbi:ATP synthase F1 subunit gamma [Patescibacteria group bacterium]|nr:ATP synthase F1 subunit gamma [Patescibacteria group bacterium]
MAVSTKIIRRRIKSITNTKKITKAMELVAASKMRKAQQATLRTRSYADRAWSLISDLAGKTDSNIHSFLVKKDKIKKVCVVLVSSDRGLCGGFNAQIIKKIAEFSRGLTEKNIELEFITIGKKSKDFAARHKMKIIADFTNLSSVTRLAEIRAVGKIVIDDFSAGKYDEVYLAYTDFISTISQRPRILKLLPFSRERDFDLGRVGKEKKTEEEVQEKEHEFIFEPSPDQVLEYMLPRMAEMQIFQAILESNASEHSARMVAMKNASDSAEDMIFDLTLMYNQVRQSAITKEIMEIVSGKAALE